MCVSYLMCTWRTADLRDSSSAEIDGGWYDPTVIAETCDMVRVMCYDMHSVSGKGMGPVRTAPWTRDAIRFWMRHIPREKLVMGLPAYSRDFVFTPRLKAETVFATLPRVHRLTEFGSLRRAEPIPLRGRHRERPSLLCQ